MLSLSVAEMLDDLLRPQCVLTRQTCKYLPCLDICYVFHFNIYVLMWMGNIVDVWVIRCIYGATDGLVCVTLALADLYIAPT